MATCSQRYLHVLLEECPLSAANRPLQHNLEIVPSSPAMVMADRRLPHEPGGDLRLRRALRAPTWDICLIDCPSGWGSIVHNALLASTHVIIPINSAPEALDVAYDTLPALGAFLKRMSNRRRSLAFC